MIKQIRDFFMGWYLRRSGITDEHDDQFRIVKYPVQDEITSEFEHQYELQRRHKMSWVTVKNGFQSMDEVIKYYYKVVEYLHNKETKIIPIQKK